MASESAESKRVRQARTFIALFSLGTALVIAGTALNHRFTAYDYLAPLQNWARANLVMLESLALVTPGWLLGFILCRFSACLGRLLGAGFVAGAGLLYLLDLLCWIGFGQRLLSAHTFAVFWPILKNFTEYLTFSNSRELMALSGGYVAVELLLLVIATAISRTTTQRPATKPTKAAALVLAVCVAPSVFVMPASQLHKQFAKHADRHPIALIRLLDPWLHVLPDAGLWDVERGRWTAQLLAMRSSLQKTEREYVALGPVSAGQNAPDIVLVLAESLRHDAIDAIAAPHMSDLAACSLVALDHHSAGNGTEFGFFGLLFGLDPAFYPRARESIWRPALPRLLRRAGYHCAFFGTYDLQYFGIENWVTPDVFNTIALGEERRFHVRDAHLIAKARKLLAREGEFASLRGKPVCAVLYLYTTHLDYDFAAEDELFVPYANNVSLLARPNAQEQQLLRNRYRNSVHCLDRLVAPLFAEDRIVAIMGDHGESLGEDGTIWHASRLAESQLRTPLIMHVPGAEPRMLQSTTFHVDVLPTLLEAIGVKPKMDLLSGRSLLQIRQPRQILSMRNHSEDASMLISREKESGAPRPYLRVNLWKAQLEPLGYLNARAQWVAPALDEHTRYAALVNEWFTNLSGDLKLQDVYQRPVPALLKALESTESEARLAAIEALVRLKAADPLVLASLRKMVRHDDGATRRAAVRALAALENKR